VDAGSLDGPFTPIAPVRAWLPLRGTSRHATVHPSWSKPTAPSIAGLLIRASTIRSCVHTDRVEGRWDVGHLAVAWPGEAVISSLTAHALLQIVRSESETAGWSASRSCWESKRLVLLQARLSCAVGIVVGRAPRAQCPRDCPATGAGHFERCIAAGGVAGRARTMVRRRALGRLGEAGLRRNPGEVSASGARSAS